jgi:hypothetical protein
MTRTFASLLLLIAGVMLISGCGGSSNAVWVKGKLLKGGARYAPPEGHLVSVTFVAMEIQDRAGKTLKSNEPFEADYKDEDGSFTVPGQEGRGIPPGKYRIAVTQKMLREAFEAAKPKAKPGQKPITRETDFLDDRFGQSTSPIVREIKGPSDLVIDMDKPTEG